MNSTLGKGSDSGGRPVSDEEAARLWQAFLHGENPHCDEAFDRLYASYLPVVLRFCRFRLRDAASAEDVANTVFVRLLETRPRLKSSFTGLLLRTARNLCATHLAKRRPLIEQVLDAEADESGDPAEDMERRDSYAALAQCLDRLSEEDRSLIVLHHGEGLTYRQVKEALSLQVAFSTLTRRLGRIRAKLLACLKEKKIF